MLVTDTNVFLFRYKEIWFSDRLFDVSGCDSVIFLASMPVNECRGFRCIQEYHTLIIDLAPELGTIWNGMSKSNCRKPINRAIKDGVEIKIDQGHREFYDLYRQFYRQKGFNGKAVTIDFMKKYGMLLVAQHGGEILSGLLFLHDDENMIELISASRRMDANYVDRDLVSNANKLLVWEAIKHAKSRGIKYYDRGGLYVGSMDNVQMDGVNFYKKSFGGRHVVKYHYRKDYSRCISLLKKYAIKDPVPAGIC
jgi:lipid II:glycine glycyltransferase (peptidoglycan interpeptide bridge formation enzyme)